MARCWRCWSGRTEWFRDTMVTQVVVLPRSTTLRVQECWYILQDLVSVSEQLPMALTCTNGSTAEVPGPVSMETGKLAEEGAFKETAEEGSRGGPALRGLKLRKNPMGGVKHDCIGRDGRLLTWAIGANGELVAKQGSSRVLALSYAVSGAGSARVPRERRLRSGAYPGSLAGSRRMTAPSLPLVARRSPLFRRPCAVQALRDDPARDRPRGATDERCGRPRAMLASRVR